MLRGSTLIGWWGIVTMKMATEAISEKDHLR